MELMPVGILVLPPDLLQPGQALWGSHTSPVPLSHTSQDLLHGTNALLGPPALLSLRFAKGSLLLLADASWLKGSSSCGSRGQDAGKSILLILELGENVCLVSDIHQPRPNSLGS